MNWTQENNEQKGTTSGGLPYLIAAPITKAIGTNETTQQFVIETVSKPNPKFVAQGDTVYIENSTIEHFSKNRFPISLWIKNNDKTVYCILTHIIEHKLVLLLPLDHVKLDSESLLNTFFEIYSSALIIGNIKDEKILLINKKAKELLVTDNLSDRPSFSELFGSASNTLWENVAANNSKRTEIEYKRPNQSILNLWITSDYIVLGDETYFILTITNRTHEAAQERLLNLNQSIAQSILNFMPSHISFKDLNGRYIELNENEIKEIGLKKSEILYKTPEELFDANIAKEIRQLEAKVLTDNQLHKSEVEIHNELGESKYFLMHTSPWYDNNGELTGTFDFDIDITEMKQLEIKLRESEKRYLEFIENLPELICEIDLNGKILYVNQYAISKFGYTKQEVYAETFNVFQIFAESDRLRAYDSLKTRLKSGDPTPVEYMAITKTGTEFPVIVYVTPIVSQSKVVGMRGVMIDITERKKNEQFLEKALATNQMMLEGIPFGVLIIDKTRRIINTNAAGLEILNRKRDELVGQTCPTEICSDREICATLDIGSKIVDEKSFIDNKGETKYLIRSVTPILIDGEKVCLQSFVDITSQKQAEERFLKTFNSSVAMMLIVRKADGSIIEVNQTTQKALGFIPSVITQLDYIDDLTDAGRKISDLLAIESVTNQEFTIKNSNNTSLIVLVSAEEITIRSDQYQLFMITDITERKKADLEIQRNLKQQEILSQISMTLNSLEDFDTNINDALAIIGEHVNVSRVYIFQDSANGETTTNTHEWCNVGISNKKDKLVNIPYTEISSWKRMLENSGIVYSEDISLLPADISKILKQQSIKSIIVFPLFVENQIKGFVGFDECITERKWSKSEIELLKTLTNILSNAVERKTNDLETKAIINSLPDLLLHINKQGFILNHNQTNQVSPFEDIVKKNKRIFETDSRSLGQEILFSIETTFDTYQHIFEFEYERAGQILDFEARFTKINDNELIALVRDITERKKSEKILSVSKERAEQASIAKSQFLANMSHEIRTPMNAILGFSEILLESTTDPKFVKHLSTILSSGRTLLALINDVLDLSKIEAGKLDIEPMPTDISALIFDMQQLFGSKAATQGIAFHVDVDASVPQTLLIDDIRIRQVLFNLAGNAVKFTHSGFVKISAKALPTNHSGKIDLTIEIQDTGIGIAPEQIEEVFEAFRQQDGNITRKYGGTGLGLAITRKLVEKMNGEISVISKPGSGSTFVVKLFGVEKVAHSLQKLEQDERATISKLKFKGQKILIVDDFQLNIDMITEMLKNLNLDIITAESGEEAVTMATNHSPEVILMDIRMKGMSGVEATSILRHQNGTKDIKVVAFTASAMKTEYEEFSELFDAVLLKPAKKRDILETLKQFIEFEDHSIKLAPESKFAQLTVTDKVLLQTAISEIENNVMPLWSQLKENLIIFEIKEFNDQLKDFAEQHQCNTVVEYCIKMDEYISMFDIEGVESHMKQFPELINYLKTYL